MKEEFELYKQKTEAAERSFSPSFCFSKWYEANISFHTGETHSCCHTPSHPIEQAALLEKPSALHNSSQKISERKEMLSGVRPKSCEYCWSIEDLGKDLMSDRHIRNGTLFSAERVQEIQTRPLGFHANPEYIELSFSNLCNFKCGYCHPKASSRYFNEIKEFGPYPGVQNHRCDTEWLKIYQEEENPYIEAWWKWWPELSKDLKILRITGGEPLIQKSTYKMLDYLDAFPSPQLELNINSNMGSRPEIIDRFCERISALTAAKKIRAFKLYSSIDTWGEQAAYIRSGLHLETFEKNIRSYLQKTNSPLTLMVTFNIFSLISFSDLLKKILEWRSEFHQENKDFKSFHRIRFDISYLKEPLQYDINILPKEEYLNYLQDHLQFMKSHVDDAAKDKFSYMEYQKLLRTYEYMKFTRYPQEKIIEGRKDFFRFFSEMDRRRQTNLLACFPQMWTFWNQCRQISEEMPAELAEGL